MRNCSLALTSVFLTLLCLACADSPQTSLSPSPLIPASAASSHEDSALKVHAPTDLSPNSSTVGFTRPTLSFTNAVAEFVPVGLAYDIEVQDRSGRVVYGRTIGESPESSAHALDGDLARGETYWWRVRARLGDDPGPWSDFAVFGVAGNASGGSGPSGPSRGGPLPFPVPGECGPFGAGDRSACVAAMVGASPWWPSCHHGSGVDCHRFTRSIAAALAVHDGNWGLISKNPGEQQCTWDWCAPGDGSGYGEDIVAYHTGGGNWIGWDTVIGAGGSGASAQWSEVGGRRGGNDWRPVPPFP